MQPAGGIRSFPAFSCYSISRVGWAQVGAWIEGTVGIHMANRGGIYPNLFDAHPPFQIDGNFGATAGIAEMLLQ